jgi:hypothetical protein
VPTGRGGELVVCRHERSVEVLRHDDVQRIGDGQVVPQLPSFGDQGPDRDPADGCGQEAFHCQLDPDLVIRPAEL